MSSSVIVWFRDDLRINDNPALLAAIETGLPVLALYI
ncbi:MAG: photolyase, partial [Pseudomonadota bacterium]